MLQGARRNDDIYRKSNFVNLASLQVRAVTVILCTIESRRVAIPILVAPMLVHLVLIGYVHVTAVYSITVIATVLLLQRIRLCL